MADSLCGPSTALKSFSDHTNRDRSLHQDRLATAPGRPGTSNFRSMPAGPSNDAEVRAFAAGTPAGLQPEVLQLPSMAGPAAFQSRMAHTPPMPGMYASPAAGPIAQPGLSAPGQMHTNWAAEFSATQRASPASLQTSSPAPNLAAAAFGGLPQQQNMMLLRQQQQQQQQQQSLYQQQNMYQQPLYNAYQPQPSYAPSIPLAQKQPESATAPAVSSTGIAGLSEADLEARFAQLEADTDFQSEMDAWMATYGPSAEERQAPQQAEKQQQQQHHQQHQGDDTKEASAASVDRLADALEAQKLATQSAEDAEELARAQAAMEAEQERARQNEELQRQQEDEEKQRQREGDELARTAEQIVGVLDNHPAARFRESNFISLMRRIQHREVVVRGEELIDENTGEPVKVAVNDKSGEADDASGGVAESSSPAPV